MTRRQWTAQEKLIIVLEGLKGESSIGELCNRHQISQGMYYKWRDQLLSNGAAAFEAHKPDRQVQRLKEQNRQLKTALGEAMMELKKSDWELGR